MRWKLKQIIQSIKKNLYWSKWQQTLQGPLRSHNGECPGNKKPNNIGISRLK